MITPEESKRLVDCMPHREPFVFVDTVVKLDPCVSATCLKTFSEDASFFAGHFPGNPIVPGVILAEALAQAAGIAGAGYKEDKRFLLSAVRSMKFLSAAKPGQQITLHARKAGEMGGLMTFEVRATIGDQIVAEGSIILSEA